MIKFKGLIKKKSAGSQKTISGQILTEIIVAVLVVGILIGLSAQLLNVSLYSLKGSGDRQISTRLAEEIFEGLQAVIFSNTSSTQGWNKIYLPPDGTGDAYNSKGKNNPYYLIILDNTWQIASGTETITLEDKNYTRYFYIENVCRDEVNGNISTTTIPCPSGTWEDPGTQKITAVVIPQDQSPFVFSQYFSRLLNESSFQIKWSVINCGPIIATSSDIDDYCQADDKADLSNDNCVGDVASCLRILRQ